MNDYRQYAIFNGNPHISPFMVIFAVFGIFFLVAFPPVGIIMLIGAFQLQRRFRGRVKRVRGAYAALEEEKRYREEILSWKSLP